MADTKWTGRVKVNIKPFPFKDVTQRKKTILIFYMNKLRKICSNSLYEKIHLLKA